MLIMIKGGQVYDRETGEFVKQDLLIEDHQIVRIAKDIQATDIVDQIIDAENRIIVPGLIDLHVHFREPGFEQKETIMTGSMAAARGGYTTVACMPNTRPVIDTVETVQSIKKRAEEAATRVLMYGAITVRELGENLTDMHELAEAGVIGFTDDGVGVQTSAKMKEAMKKAKSLNLPIVAHCEDNSLAKGGCVHEGVFAKQHDLPGIPNEAEAIHVGRDILLAESTGAHYHVCHISAKESVRLVREAKSRGQKVTAEVTPHHLLLCDEDIPAPDAMWKMNPPLRGKADREALIEGLQDGTIDFIATDHAPHTTAEKAVGMKQAPFGIVGLETAFPLLYTHLVCTGILTLPQLIDKMTYIPATTFGLPFGELAEGKTADLTMIDLHHEQVIDPERFHSKGRNTPFKDWKVKGWPVLTMLNGKITWSESKKTIKG
ncbi:dihydroorotase [Hazenella sp. IB182357]|uniref:Dihydroorotase n=1 Tax=Polycladospora coralii TaxID=2771432 RepID=A0A926N849_9BACL|nr:dihydroorotase [Polycladospora coralii]MBD1371348.1 dihydroorotase [Polycladospora coralii]MBS7530316.1 dihydroorotase [Polycladospora coralii]